MSGLILRDGSGRGYSAQVGSDLRLHTHAMVEPRSAIEAQISQQGYRVTTSPMTVTAATDTFVAWARNNDSTNLLFVECLSLSWNGGSTNYNRPCRIMLYAGAVEPSANYQIFQGAASQGAASHNTYIGSANESDTTLYEWDEVGSGMTVADRGELFADLQVPPGLTSLPLRASLIVPKDAVLGVAAESPETGELAVGIAYYMTTLER